MQMNSQNNMVLMMGNMGPTAASNVNHAQTSKNAISKSSNFSQNILQQIGAVNQNVN